VKVSTTIPVPDDGPLPAANRAANDWLVSYRLTPDTLRTYAGDIADWFRFCASCGVDPLEADQELVRQYEAWMYDQGRASD
jgi:hypothetical protein